MSETRVLQGLLKLVKVIHGNGWLHLRLPCICVTPRTLMRQAALRDTVLGEQGSVIARIMSIREGVGATAQIQHSTETLHQDLCRVCCKTVQQSSQTEIILPS
jgi:hypothetical protein